MPFQVNQKKKSQSPFNLQRKGVTLLTSLTAHLPSVSAQVTLTSAFIHLLLLPQGHCSLGCMQWNTLLSNSNSEQASLLLCLSIFILKIVLYRS